MKKSYRIEEISHLQVRETGEIDVPNHNRVPIEGNEDDYFRWVKIFENEAVNDLCDFRLNLVLPKVGYLRRELMVVPGTKTLEMGMIKNLGQANDKIPVQMKFFFDRLSEVIKNSPEVPWKLAVTGGNYKSRGPLHIRIGEDFPPATLKPLEEFPDNVIGYYTNHSEEGKLLEQNLDEYIPNSDIFSFIDNDKWISFRKAGIVSIPLNEGYNLNSILSHQNFIGIWAEIDQNIRDCAQMHYQDKFSLASVWYQNSNNEAGLRISLRQPREGEIRGGWLETMGIVIQKQALLSSEKAAEFIEKSTELGNNLLSGLKFDKPLYSL